MMRSKRFALLALAAAGALLFLVWTLPWFEVELVAGVTSETELVVTGESAAPPLVPVALALLALVAALAIAGRSVRPVLAAVVAALGAAVIASSVGALTAPQGAVARPLAELTGLEGDRAIEMAVDAVEATAIPVLTIALGALIIILGAWMLFTARGWTVTSSRYENASRAKDDSASSRGSVSTWDSLSSGDDPTGDPETR